jgi:hypothetical protein
MDHVPVFLVGARAVDSMRQRGSNFFSEVHLEIFVLRRDPAIEYAIQQCELLPNPEWHRVPV